MSTIARLSILLGSLALASSGGINWKTVWLEPNPIILQFPGPPASYVVKGINGADYQADLTKSQHLKVMSSDTNVIEFSECVSLNRVVVAAD